MRTIKFRAWDKDGDNPQFKGGKGVMICHEYLMKKGGLRYLIPAFDGIYPIMQFTGLLDKNGKEIYEGDVIKVQTTVNHHYNDDFFEPPVEIEQELIGQIVYRNDLAGFDVETIKPDLYLKNWGLMEDSIDVVEVIGNIHQNPSLL